MINFPKVEFSGFQGVWDRGNPDEVPFNHFVDALNCRFNTLEGVFTREGSSKGIAFPHAINDWMLVKRPNSLSVIPISELIICDGSGNYYRTSDNTLILNLANGLGLIGVNLFGRAYFCPIVTNYQGSSLYLYDGTNTRLAAGSGPPAVPAMGFTWGAGNIPLGKRTIYCGFFTDSGYLTGLGAQVVFNPDPHTLPYPPYSINLNTIPLGPASTTKRYLFSTQSGGTIPYFIPEANGGIINDNVATTAVLNFYDTDLQESADYLLNLLNPISPAMGCIPFANRLVVWPGPVAGEGGSAVMLSNKGDFETFDQTTCYIIVNRDDGYSVITAFVLNNVIYFCKDLGVYSTFDNGGDPDTWDWNLVDSSISVPPKGIAYVSTQQGNVVGSVILADKTGLVNFNGTFQRPELTWKVESTWKRINKAAWKTLQISVDPLSHSIYCAIPLDNATSPSHILFGDYSYALDEDIMYIDPTKIKWDLWQFPNKPTVVGMIDLTGDSYPVLRIGSIDNIGNLIQLDPTQEQDYGNNISSYIQTAYGFLMQSKRKTFSDYNSFFVGAKWNAFGDALLTCTGFGYNAKIQRQLFTRQLAAASGVDLINPFNLTSQKLSLKLAASSGKFTIDYIAVYCKPMFQVTPQ
jgi:hypothetical protein